MEHYLATLNAKLTVGRAKYKINKEVIIWRSYLAQSVGRQGRGWILELCPLFCIRWIFSPWNIDNEFFNLSNSEHNSYIPLFGNGRSSQTPNCEELVPPTQHNLRFELLDNSVIEDVQRYKNWFSDNKLTPSNNRVYRLLKDCRFTQCNALYPHRDWLDKNCKHNITI